MSVPIYHLWIVRGFHEAYYQLSPEKRNQFWANAAGNPQAVGAKPIVACDSRWCNEAYSAWGIEEYPDVQAVQKATRAHEESEHFRYIKSETYLGTKIEGFQTSSVDFPNPIYQLFLVKNSNNNDWASLSQDTRDRIFAGVMESIKKNGGVPFLGCDIDWSNEEYANFGVIAWPNIEAEQAHFKDLEKLSWHRYTYGKTILGTPL